MMASQPAPNLLRTVLALILFVVIPPFLPLLISQRWNWWEAWVLVAVYILGFAASRGLAARRNPDLITERARLMQHQDTKPWDRLLAPLVALGGVLIPLSAGLDERFDASPEYSLPLKIAGLVIFLGGYLLGSYALIENRFFSGVVRLQSDRGQTVVSSGPYGWMRHPGYAGAIFSYLAIPIFLDAAWAFLPALFLTAVLVIRTHLEDQTLQAELPGYPEYAGLVRFRLLPGLW